jgi:hydroxymethylpyrimidine/phosphomethylpyrimidine kinase
MKGRVLVIAGSDSGGGAGIQADIKTVTALGGYAATAITALTAQNTQGVFGVMGVPAEFIQRQINLVLDDIGADAIKTGMLHNAEVIEAVVESLGDWPKRVPLVVDPVMVAKGGAALLEPEANVAMRKLLLPLAAILTPNLPEAEALTGHTISSIDDMRRVAEQLGNMGARAVLLKGGHLPGPQVQDLLWSAQSGMEIFAGERFETLSTHGTGCTLASGIATGLAQGLELRAAVMRARDYVREAIRTAPGFGKGHGPLNHAHTVGA